MELAYFGFFDDDEEEREKEREKEKEKGLRRRI